MKNNEKAESSERAQNAGEVASADVAEVHEGAAASASPAQVDLDRVEAEEGVDVFVPDVE